MIKKIKEYMEYRRNKKIAKRELAKIAATTLPLINNTVKRSADIMNFITRLATEVNNVGLDEFIKTVQIEIVSYIVENISDKDETNDN